MLHKVTISSPNGFVRFEASSPVSESRVANYEGYNIVHLPTSLWAYRNTNGRHFSISGKLVSRTASEADANAGYLSTVRSWLLPGFGTTGSTPPIVNLTAYSNKNINQVPCVVISYSWTFPDDVDYIFSATEPMPVIGMLSIELEEAYSADQITAGDWNILPGEGGEFSYVGEPGSLSGSDFVTVETKPRYQQGFVGLAGKPTTFPKLGGMLTLSPGIIAKLPTMASKVVGAATNSPLLSVIAAEGTGLLNNQFISGSSAQQVNDNSTASPAAASAEPSFFSDPFGRLSNLITPVFRR